MKVSILLKSIAKWIVRSPVTGGQYDAECQELRESLGPFGFLWLCGCAVYPVLRFPLTVHLGQSLARTVGRPPPDEDEHLSLCRLPWFRGGRMPEALRLALLRKLDPGLHPVVRQAIEQLLHSARRTGPADTRESGAELDFIPERRRWRDRWRRDPGPPEGTRRDTVFVTYMMGRLPREGDLALDRRLSRLFGLSLIGWLGGWTLPALLLALAAGSGLWSSADDWLQPLFRSTTVTATIPLPAMVRLPAGEFRMGSPDTEAERYSDEGPQHRVRIAAFDIGKYAVTFAEWDACVADGGCNGYRPGDEGWGRERRPVINVSWNDAQTYVQWLNRRTGQRYRLPSEAEWEYAARAGTTTPFYTGKTISTDQANYDGNYTYNNGPKGVYRQQTSEVGSFPANGFGLHDMAGNVWQWVEDAWHKDYHGAPPDGSAWTIEDGNSARVVRGGSWFDVPRVLRSAFRVNSTPGNRYYNFGFRVARTLTP